MKGQCGTVQKKRENENVRKNIVGTAPMDTQQQPGAEWLDLERRASVEVTSEDPGFPVESVFGAGQGNGWRAAEPGPQRIRITFDEPTAIHRIQLQFSEPEIERTQEFNLRYTTDRGETREIVRQRWNFSPHGSTSEAEDYRVDLEGVKVLELGIDADVSHSGALASLTRWRVG
jgi:hypothetical protein